LIATTRLNDGEFIVVILITQGLIQCCRIIWEFTGIPEATVHIFTSLDDVIDT